jgi:hypothetical protein
VLSAIAAGADGATQIATVSPGRIATRRAPPLVACVVPRLRGKTLATARQVLILRNCVLGRIRRAHTRGAGPGRIAFQSATPGTRLQRRAQVDVVVSRGRR